MSSAGSGRTDPGRAPAPPLRGVVLGLSITSSWGNGHATTYRGLARELNARGHEILFLERDQPWYRDNRDLPRPPYARAEVYSSLVELQERFSDEVRRADFVMVGSFVPDGVRVGEWVTQTAHGATVFYDIDTPVTLAGLEEGRTRYLSPALVSRYDLYLSFTGGPTLARIRDHYGARRVAELYCSADPALYFPERRPVRWDLGYLGTYSDDRQPVLDALLLEPARRHPPGRFVVAGPQYPPRLSWPRNVERILHLSPAEHRAFYNAQRFALNVTRADMVLAGHSPSVRLLEAAACGTPLLSDYWVGLDRFFAPDEEILVVRSPADTLRHLLRMPEDERVALGARARARVLAEHTAAHRAAELEAHLVACLGERAGRAASRSPSGVHAPGRSAARVRPALDTAPTSGEPP